MCFLLQSTGRAGVLNHNLSSSILQLLHFSALKFMKIIVLSSSAGQQSRSTPLCPPPLEASLCAIACVSSRDRKSNECHFPK